MHIRDAVKEDAYDLARLHALAADGLVEYSYSDLVADVDPIELFGRVFEAGHEPYSHRNCVVAEDAGCVVGKVHTYGCDDIASVMPDDPYIPAERLAIINSAFPPTPVSWHIEAMAVLPEFQGRGLGRRFIELAKDQGREKGFDTLSLHVFEANEGARRLYQRCGFKAVGRVPIPDELSLPHLRANILMVCDLALSQA
jgi:ribosomal protein S18 acetylase RimI-like enzyme